MSASSKRIIRYDPEADILLIKISDGNLHDEILLDNDVVIQLDDKGNVIGIEVWDASKRGLKEAINELNKAIKKSRLQYSLTKVIYVLAFNNHIE